MLLSKTYRQFSRQRYNRWKHQYPGIRQSELVSKIIHAWEKMSDKQKMQLGQTYLQKNFITEDVENSEDQLQMLKVTRQSQKQLSKNWNLQSIQFEKQNKIKEEILKNRIKNIDLPELQSKDNKVIQYKNRDQDNKNDKNDDDDEEEEQQKPIKQIKYILYPQQYKVVHYYLVRIADKQYSRSVIFYAHRVAQQVTVYLNQFAKNHCIASEICEDNANSDQINLKNSENEAQFEIQASQKQQKIAQKIIQKCLMFATIAFFLYYNKQVAERQYQQFQHRHIHEPQYPPVRSKFSWHLEFNMFYTSLNKKIPLPLLIRQKTISFIWQTIKKQLLIANFDETNPQLQNYILPANKMDTLIKQQQKKNYLQIQTLPILIDLPKKQTIYFPEIQAPHEHLQTPFFKKLSKKQRNQLKKAEKRQKK